MKKSVLNVMYLTDNNYVVFAGVSIISLFENNKNIDVINVYVIDDSIADENKKIYKQIAERYGREIIFLDLSRGLEILQEMKAPQYRNSYTTYLKLFAFDLLPEDVDRIFFIDSDSIVVGCLEEMISFDMQGKMVGAVRDGISHPYKVALGYPEEDSWFNMGVMLVDVHKWKSDKAQQKVIEQLKKRNAYIAVDQDILNITQHGNICTLHPKYNATPHHYIYSYDKFMKALPQKGFYDKKTIEEANKEPVIRHFERFIGESPWNKNSVHPYTELFDSYLKISPWKDYEKKIARKTIILKIEKILYKLLPHDVFLKIWAMAFKHYLDTNNKKMINSSNIKNIC